jgi:carbonic anhydrase
MTHSRREFFTAAAAVGAVGVTALAGASTPARAADAKAAAGAAKTGLTPDQALDLLIKGNRDFLNDRPNKGPVNGRRRLEIALGQAPIAAYVSCSDSRVSPEILFGRGLGELFIIRNAGNTVDTVALGSIEYAVAELGVPLVVIMGHERCGAVKAAVDVVQNNATYPGSIGRMVEPIIPAVLQAKLEKGDLLDNSVRANVRRVVKQLRTATDPLLLAPQGAGKVKVVGAYYDLDTGRVDFFDRP